MDRSAIQHDWKMTGPGEKLSFSDSISPVPVIFPDLNFPLPLVVLRLKTSCIRLD